MCGERARCSARYSPRLDMHSVTRYVSIHADNEEDQGEEDPTDEETSVHRGVAHATQSQSDARCQDGGRQRTGTDRPTRAHSKACRFGRRARASSQRNELGGPARGRERAGANSAKSETEEAKANVERESRARTPKVTVNERCVERYTVRPRGRRWDAAPPRSVSVSTIVVDAGANSQSP